MGSTAFYETVVLSSVGSTFLQSGEYTGRAELSSGLASLCSKDLYSLTGLWADCCAVLNMFPLTSDFKTSQNMLREI